MFYLRQARKAGIFIALALFFTLGIVFAETEQEALNKGVEYINQGNYDEAITELAKVIELNPNSADAYYNRGLAYDDKSNYDQGISDYNKAIELNPNYTNAYNNRGIDYYRKGNYDMAWQDVHKAESLGLSVSPFWLEDLKKDSGRDK